MKIQIMSEHESVDMADEFPEWVSELLRESADGARETIRWFIKALYSKGYEIGKRI